MTIESIDDLKRRALATIWEMRATDSDFAAALKPDRVARVENLIAALRRRAHESSAPAAERLAALEAIAEIESQLRDALDGERARNGSASLHL
ncbi:MAG TPA: hypothetical protein VFO61_05200 [Alphaproteobacteria bacterium]|nr:hypothetical protein [Alphaproteobacteria bacterium]